MVNLIQSIHRFKNITDTTMDRFVRCHPYLSYLIIFVGMPLGVLLAVFVFSILQKTWARC